MLAMTFAGGGIRGAVELGIVKALYERGIRPTIFTGTSAGSIVSGLLACGHEPEEAFEKFSKMGSGIMDIAYWHILKGLFTPSKVQGLIKGDRLEAFLSELYKGRKLNAIPTNHRIGVVSTDIQTGKQIIFASQYADDTKYIGDDTFDWVVDRSMDMSFAIRSSSSFPAVFLPKSYRDYVLVDGGLVNNVPSDVARALGATQVITIDLGYNGKKEPAGNILSIAGKSIDIMMERVTDENNECHGIYINPDVHDAGVFDFGEMDALFERGYKYGRQIVDEVLAKLGGETNG